MLIGLHDAEMTHFKRHKKSFPNLALMKIAAWHKAKKDTVEWWDPLFTDKFNLIYSSKVFDFTPENLYLPSTAIRGGTGYPDVQNLQLPQEIDDIYPDYAIYPDCDYAIGYLTRGCPNHCRWCIVPRKEGDIKPYRKWQEIVRPDTDKLVLMDNNILASEHGINELENLIGSGYQLDLNQGMDARLVTDQVAQILAKLKWIRFIRFSCDQRSQIDSIFDATERLGRYGIKTYRLFIYLLITKNLDDAAYRVEKLRQLKGINLYAQPEQNKNLGIIPDLMQKEFAQRYIYSGCFRKETWKEYVNRKGIKY